MYMLRDYQIEICERVREAFKKHRSVMVQMPTGTGKTAVLAELVNEELRNNVRRPKGKPMKNEDSFDSFDSCSKNIFTCWRN